MIIILALGYYIRYRECLSFFTKNAYLQFDKRPCQISLSSLVSANLCMLDLYDIMIGSHET